MNPETTHFAATADEPINISENERIASLAGGIALFFWGLRIRSALTPLLMFLGGALVRRGAIGHCPVYAQLEKRRAKSPESHEPESVTEIQQSVQVARPPAQVFGYWRQVENFPRFMTHLESVEALDDRVSRWTARSPSGQTLEWEAEIIALKAGQWIEWRSLPGASVQVSGAANFEPLNEGRETMVSVIVRLEAGASGAVAARILGDNPRRQLEQDLLRFKQLVETDTDAAGSLPEDTPG